MCFGRGLAIFKFDFFAFDGFCHEAAVYVTYCFRHHGISWRYLWPIYVVPLLFLDLCWNRIVNLLLSLTTMWDSGNSLSARIERCVKEAYAGYWSATAFATSEVNSLRFNTMMRSAEMSTAICVRAIFEKSRWFGRFTGKRCLPKEKLRSTRAASKGLTCNSKEPSPYEVANLRIK